jgi:hypothetical protein
VVAGGVVVPAGGVMRGIAACCATRCIIGDMRAVGCAIVGGFGRRNAIGGASDMPGGLYCCIMLATGRC